MRFVVIIIVGLGISSFYSCDEDSFSRVVEIDVPKHEPKLVLNALLDGNDTTISIRVSESGGILEDRGIGGISNAVVRVLQNHQLLGLAIEDQNDFGSYLLGTPMLFESNQKFEIQVEADGFLNVHAADQVPTKVPIRAVRFEKDGAINLDGGRQDLITIEFQDPAGEENFYAIDARTNTIEEDFLVDPNGDTIYYQSSDHLYLDSNDPLLQYSYNYGLVTNDAAFEGKTARLDVLTSVWHQADSIVVSLVSLSKTGFLYDRSFTNFRDADGNPFAEPVTVHSNVENGYGIFAVNSRSEIVLPIR